MGGVGLGELYMYTVRLEKPFKRIVNLLASAPRDKKASPLIREGSASIARLHYPRGSRFNYRDNFVLSSSSSTITIFFFIIEAKKISSSI